MMKELIYYPDFGSMPEQDLRIWFDFSFRWRDEKYIRGIKQEFKRRGLAWN